MHTVNTFAGEKIGRQQLLSLRFLPLASKEGSAATIPDLASKRRCGVVLEFFSLLSSVT